MVWGPEKTRNLVPCKKAHQAKVMAWVGIANGRVLPVYWFEGSVNSDKYLTMLQTMVWPAIRARATRDQYRTELPLTALQVYSISLNPSLGTESFQGKLSTSGPHTALTSTP